MQRELAWQKEWFSELQSIHMFSSQQSELFICRYVGNRLILSDTKHHLLGAIREFKSSYYGSTIQLETVSDHKFLDFTINAPNRTVVFNLPTDTWSIRHPRSAESWSALPPSSHAFSNCTVLCLSKKQVSSKSKCAYVSFLIEHVGTVCQSNALQSIRLKLFLFSSNSNR